KGLKIPRACPYGFDSRRPHQILPRRHPCREFSRNGTFLRSFFMTAPLFQPIAIGGLAFPNRIAIAPMCQYSADDGSATDWHLHQWMNYAMSGAGMVTVEMTNVERRGRISHGCMGLYSDHN